MNPPTPHPATPRPLPVCRAGPALAALLAASAAVLLGLAPLPAEAKSPAESTQRRAESTQRRAEPAQRRAVPAKRPAEPARRHAEPARHAVRAVGHYADRQDVAEFIGDMVARHGFDESVLRRVFGDARRSTDVLRLIAPPAPGFKRSWEAYRARFLDPLRVREGLAFWRNHQAALARAQAEWRVPPEIVVAIIGVETIYGRVTGDFRVLDALTTLAFDYPRRAAFFREELEQFLLHAREQERDARELRGSFAGAIGLPQFMPGSIRRYATDFDGDGRIDLQRSPVDAIGSVARFLAEHGWVGGEPTHFDASIGPDARLAPLVEAGIEPRFTITELAGHGVGSPQEIAPDTLLALVDLPNADAPPAYYLGARNFYVITRYNRSSFYAMAVIELSRVLAAGR